jgi:hypothetical protein
MQRMWQCFVHKTLKKVDVDFSVMPTLFAAISILCLSRHICNNNRRAEGRNKWAKKYRQNTGKKTFPDSQHSHEGNVINTLVAHPLARCAFSEGLVQYQVGQGRTYVLGSLDLATKFHSGVQIHTDGRTQYRLHLSSSWQDDIKHNPSLFLF